MSRPGRPLTDAPADPYRALVLAIVHRAVQDAVGRCHPTVSQPRRQIQAEAQAWLQDDAAVAGLLELAGYAPDAVLARLRQWQGTVRP